MKRSLWVLPSRTNTTLTILLSFFFERSAEMTFKNEMHVPWLRFYRVCICFSNSGPQCFRSVLYQRLNVKRAFLMNFKPVLCWVAAWYDICHNTHTPVCMQGAKRAGQQVCFLSHLRESNLLLLHSTLRNASSPSPYFQISVFAFMTSNSFVFGLYLIRLVLLHPQKKSAICTLQLSVYHLPPGL